MELENIDQLSKINFTNVMGNLKFPEGPAWDGKSTLDVSNCNSDWITKIESQKNSVFLKALDSPFTFKKTNGLKLFSSLKF